MNILETKQALATVQAEIKNEVAKGSEMAANKTTQLEDLRAAAAKVDELQIREALLKQDLERMENEGKPAPVKDVKKSGFANKGEFLKAVHDAATHGIVDSRLSSVRNAATGMNETTDAEGGYLVPPEYAEGVLDLVETQSVLYPQARKVTISSNRLIENIIDETSRVDPATGSRHGGVLAYWKAEAAQYSAVKALIKERTTNVEKLTAYVPVTEELLSDAPAVESIVDALVAKEFAFKVDDMIVNGAGTNNIPMGVLASGNNALVTIPKETSQAAGTINVDNLLKMYNALIMQCRKNAAWYINQDVEMQLFHVFLQTGASAATSTSGIPLYTFPGQYGNQDGMILGKPVKPIEQCAALGTKGDIILMDATQYLIVERGGVTRQNSMHVRFDYDESVFKYTWRLGGRPEWPSAITPYKGTTQRSPYVTLATRA